MSHHDPELPAGCQDADIEQAEFGALGRRVTALRRKGICTHGWVQGQPGRSMTGPIKCLDCGQEFLTADDWHDARHQLL